MQHFDKQPNKPELLLPVGNIESLYAAIEGKADAIYLGLKDFNARGRAANFTPSQFKAVCKLAAQNHIKVYVTLNTVVKNNEISTLLDTLYFLSNQHIAGIIIQDWGVFSIMRQYFPKLIAHASTQMANHNSAGVNYCKLIGFQRVVLARELTFNELKLIQQRSKIETEVFIHGALCYSISGLCQFSSYLGGAGANRGLCTQPCRRFYNCNGEKRTFFSMKDNQLITKIKELTDIGVDSLKVEGRLKSGEYVYTVSEAYRQVIDNKKDIKDIEDLSRPKTQWFMGDSIADAIADNPNTGICIGQVTDCHDGTIIFTSSIELHKGNRLRIRTDNDNDQNAFILDNFRFDGNSYIAKGFRGSASKGTNIYLTAFRNHKFDTALPNATTSGIESKMPQTAKKEIINKIRKQLIADKKSETIIRISDLKWLNSSTIVIADKIIVSLPLSEWNNLTDAEIKSNRVLQKIWIELPVFISETKMEQAEKLCENMQKKGFNKFVISHLSQKEFLPSQSRFATNENVYAYNDAAATWLYKQGAEWITSPVENEYENLLTGACRNMVIPTYFHPHLFNSRMPVKLKNDTFTDERKNQYMRHRADGITIITPIKPVCISQYINKLKAKGFNRFLIDLSFEQPDNRKLEQILKLHAKSEGIQGSSAFNFKKGLR